MRTRAPVLVVITLAALAFGEGCPEPTCEDAAAGTPEALRCAEGEGEGEPPPPCFIGDEVAPAELELVFRSVEGTIEKLDDGDAIPLVLPVQGGKVVYVGIRGVNVTCRVQLTAGFFDTCQDPQILVGVEGRPVLLEDDGTGTAVPVNDPTDFIVSNFANVAMCPSFAASTDVNQATLRLELRVTEERRDGEDGPRVHTLGALAAPFCGDPNDGGDCNCECDADFVLERPKDEQCPTIDDNDLAPGECPVDP